MSKRSRRERGRANEASGLQKAAPIPVQAPSGVTPGQLQVLAASMAVSTTFSGPLPPPEVLKEYNEAVPDAAERILRMAEGQTAHRQNLETKVVTSDIWKSYAGVVAAFVIVITALVVGGWVAAIGQWQAAIAIAGLPTAAIVWAFIHGTNSRRQEREGRVQSLKSR